MKKIEVNDSETKSPDVVAENIERLKALFPEIVTEGKHGISVNVDVLKSLVGDKTVTDADERYGLNWHGKRQARQLALTPSTGTLRPCPGESVDWDTTQNLMIEGDNLEVLKLLQKSYAGRVKLIYIDPPYNTGKDFIYPDDFRDALRNYMAVTGQTDAEGLPTSTNSERSGRFHTTWLNMMMPRLRVALDLLSNKGVIVVSCDDNEGTRVRMLLDEVFGEENFLGDVAIVTGANQSGDGVLVQKNYEKCMVYARNSESVVINRVDKVSETMRNLNDAPTPLETREDMGYTIYYNPETKDAEAVFDYDRSKIKLNTEEAVYSTRTDLTKQGYVPIRPGFRNKKLHRWRWGKETFEQRIEEVVFRMSDKGEWGAYFVQSGLNPPKNVWNYAGGAQELAALFDGTKVFDYPKGVGFLRYITQLFAPDDALVVDFFAGSGTTAHAVLAQNADDDCRRRFLLVQIPEPVPDNSEAKKMGYEDLFSLSEERVRRVAQRIRHDNPMFAGDLGFRVFKLDSTNIHEWDPDRNALPETLEASVDHLKSDRTESDILYELLLKLGLDLCVPIEEKKIAGKTVHSVGLGVLLVCLATEITRKDAEPLALGITKWHKELAPEGECTVVFRDSAFVDDVAKTNAAAILDQYGITNVRSL